MANVGDRVRFLGFGEPDEYSALKPGTEGTVTLIDDTGTVHVRWDDGHVVGLITRPMYMGAPWERMELWYKPDFKPDRFEVLETAKP